MGIQERRLRERQARKKLVLDATRELVRERGFNGTTTKQIAKSCELSEAALFFYFKSKDEIFTSMLLEGIELMSEGMQRIASAGLSPDETLKRLWAFFGEVRDRHPEYFQVFAYLGHPQSTSSVSEEVREDLARRSGDSFRRFAALLSDRMHVVEARACADLLWASFLGLTVLRDSRVNLGSRPHPTAKEMSTVLDLLRGGVLASDGEGES